jgi:hypothetical protein
LKLLSVLAKLLSVLAKLLLGTGVLLVALLVAGLTKVVRKLARRRAS